MKCANCSNQAVFTVTHPASRPVNYCHRCIPAHLWERANAGHFPLQAPLHESPKEAPKKSKKKAEPVVEEPEVVEEATEEPSDEDL